MILRRIGRLRPSRDSRTRQANARIRTATDRDFYSRWVVMSRQSPQPSQGKQPIEDEQAQGQSCPRCDSVHCNGSGSGREQGFFRAESMVRNTSVRASALDAREGASARDLGKMLKKRQIGTSNLGRRPAGRAPGSMPCMTPPVRPIAIVCIDHAPVASQDRRLARGQAAVGRPVRCCHRSRGRGLFVLGGAARSASRPHAIASPMLVPSSPARADRTASIVSCRNRMIEDRWTRQFGIIGEDDQADQVVGPPFDEADERRSWRPRSREINRVPISVGKSTAFMLELLSSATTIATPCPAI